MRHFLILLFFSPILMVGQISDYSIKNFTIADGLPSNECHGTLQDSLGYIWIATDRGLVKFDGSKFTTYGVSKGLEDISVLSIIMDSDQSIYLSTYSKRIYKYLPEKDSIVRFEFDYLLAPHIAKANFNIIRYIDDRFIYFDLYGVGLYYIDKDNGSLITPNYQWPTLSSVDLGDKVLITHSRLMDENVYFKYRDYKLKIDIFFASKHSPTAFKLPLDRRVFCINGKRYFFEGNKLKKTTQDNEFMDVKSLKEGSILTAQIFKQGVKYYSSFENLMGNKFDIIIPEVSASHIFTDRQQNLFISTTDNGLFYLKKTIAKKVILNKYKSPDVRNIVLKDSNLLFLICNEKEVLSYSLNNDETKFIEKTIGQLYDFKWDDNYGSFLISSTFSKEKLGQFKVKKLYDEDGWKISIKKIINLDENALLLIGSGYFIVLNNVNEVPTYSSKYILPIKIVLSGISDKNNKLILGALDGLYILENKTMKKLDTIHPVFGSRINEIIKCNNIFYLATLGNGIVIWDGKNDIKIIKEVDGLLSNNVESVYVDSKGVIYACSNAGLSIIKDINGVSKIFNLTMHHGLPSNQVREVMEVGGKLYIATASGLCVLGDLPGSSESIAPVIESVRVNGLVYSPRNLPTTLKYNENNVSISFKALDIAMLGDINYRISNDEITWSQMRETNARFLDLPPGDHQFFIQAANKDGKWSNSTLYKVKILPAWWQTIYFKLAIVGLLLLIIYLIFVRRIHQLRKVNELQKEVFKLERSALAAQMNPHFIFNSLNSIQNYIITHDKETAMDYLGQFAKLIRLNLKGSIEEKVTLDNEIRLLKYYLNLEQMRFNHSFNFAIDVDEKLDTNDIRIPPLLIQPFVENAVLHGIQHMTSGGFITVAFSKNANQLMVLVTDNGLGVDPKSPPKQHQSYGMSITKKRLEKINTLSEYTYSISSRNGKPGTEVRIVIEI